MTALVQSENLDYKGSVSYLFFPKYMSSCSIKLYKFHQTGFLGLKCRSFAFCFDFRDFSQLTFALNLV